MQHLIKHKATGYIIKIVFSIGIPAIVLWYLFTKIKPVDILNTIRMVSTTWIFLGFLFYIANQAFRSIRFYFLIHFEKPKLFKLFKVQALYIFLNYFLPFRTGEISYIYLAKRYLNLPVANCISSLMISRLSDYLLLMLCYIFLVFQMQLLIPAWLGIIIKSSIVIAILAIILFVLFVCKGNKYTLYVPKKIQSKFLGGNNRIITKFAEKSKEIIASFKEISSFKVLIQVVLTTIAIWASLFLTFYIIIKSMGYSISFLHIILVLLMAMMSRLFQGVANLGSHEVGWYGALLIVGFHKKDASIIAVSSHIIILVYMLIISLYSKFTLKKEQI